MSKLVAIFSRRENEELKEFGLEIENQEEITRENTEELEKLAMTKVGYPYKKIAAWIRE